MKDFFINQSKDQNVLIGGVTSLMDFTSNEISVRVKGGYILINGDKLLIERFDENEIFIKGKIHGVTTNV